MIVNPITGDIESSDEHPALKIPALRQFMVRVPRTVWVDDAPTDTYDERVVEAHFVQTDADGAAIFFVYIPFPVYNPETGQTTMQAIQQARYITKEYANIEEIQVPAVRH